MRGRAKPPHTRIYRIPTPSPPPPPPVQRFFSRMRGSLPGKSVKDSGNSTFLQKRQLY